MSAEDERALVSKAVRDDTEAYAALLHRYSIMVYGIALRIVRDHHLAQDLAHLAQGAAGHQPAGRSETAGGDSFFHPRLYR
ncbi:MAG TPA: hypothetical protein VMS09_13750 [Paenibacillus sp.]|uniref:hypothetical protein n=1 Tax=Paenibacillus sp. TaxID=58172 RepID=UPI002CC948EC|nr:hypothetical protein [Paenibacillus sp.]HUC93065.1 hypothetical protein [Paenibacillus sp.]